MLFLCERSFLKCLFYCPLSMSDYKLIWLIDLWTTSPALQLSRAISLRALFSEMPVILPSVNTSDYKYIWLIGLCTISPALQFSHAISLRALVFWKACYTALCQYVRLQKHLTDRPLHNFTCSAAQPCYFFASASFLKSLLYCPLSIRPITNTSDWETFAHFHLLCSSAMLFLCERSFLKCLLYCPLSIRPITKASDW